jgi:small conductance mechanosensitive channel
MTIPANLQELAVNILIRLVTAGLVVLLGWWLARLCRKWVKLAAERAKLTLSMVNLLTFAAYYGILVLTALIVLSTLGVPMTSMAAISGAVVVTMGIALKETLADLAAAIIFYLFQPFKVGDTIETAGVIGKVVEIQLFFTVIRPANNRMITLPNSKIQTSGITNYSTLDVLRADVPVSIRYSDDLGKAKRLLEEMLLADERVLKQPAPNVVVQELGANGVTLMASAFLVFKDYWEFSPSMREHIKLRFETEGISIPPLQQDVRLIQAEGWIDGPSH